MQKSKIHTARQYELYIGVDCGVNTGLCVWSRSRKEILLLQTLKIHQAMWKVVSFLESCQLGQMVIRIEDARLRTWIPRQKTISAELGRREGAGSVKRDALIWEDICTDYGIAYELVPPKNNKTKMKAEAFRAITKYSGSTTSHSRDAAMLVFGS